MALAHRGMAATKTILERLRRTESFENDNDEEYSQLNPVLLPLHDVLCIPDPKFDEHDTILFPIR